MIKISSRLDLSVRYEVLRNGSFYKQIYASGTPSITMQSDSELKVSLSGTFHDYSALPINFLSDKLRVIANINGTEYPCGIYCVTTEDKAKSSGSKFISIEAYSLLYLAKQSMIESRLYFAAGELYTDVIEEILIECGITDYDITASELTLATDREDWEIGTSRLEIVNQLLKEISYNTAYPDNAGAIICEPYAEPNISNVDFTYNADYASIIGPDYTISNDYHGKQNVFTIICSNPDLEAPLTATSENDDTSSPFSTANIGRVLSVSHIDNISNIAALQLKANELRMLSMISSEEVTFETAINPEHSVFNIVALNNDDLQGIFAETSWTMNLSASALMTHKARRALYQTVQYLPLVDSDGADVYDSNGDRINVKNFTLGVESYVSDYTGAEMDAFIASELGV